MDYKFIVFRDSDHWRLRKVVVELYADGALSHRTRMFWRPGKRWMTRALALRKAWMLRASKLMNAE